MVDVAQLVRVSDCDSEGRGFEPRLPPQSKLRHNILSPLLYRNSACCDKIHLALKALFVLILQCVVSDYICSVHAKVAELVDAQVLGTCAVRRESSSLSFRTIRTEGC